MFSQTVINSDIRRNILHKFTEPRMHGDAMLLYFLTGSPHIRLEYE